MDGGGIKAFGLNAAKSMLLPKHGPTQPPSARGQDSPSHGDAASSQRNTAAPSMPLDSETAVEMVTDAVKRKSIADLVVAVTLGRLYPGEPSNEGARNRIDGILAGAIREPDGEFLAKLKNSFRFKVYEEVLILMLMHAFATQKNSGTISAMLFTEDVPFFDCQKPIMGRILETRNLDLFNAASKMLNLTIDNTGLEEIKNGLVDILAHRSTASQRKDFFQFIFIIPEEKDKAEKYTQIVEKFKGNAIIGPDVPSRSLPGTQ